MDVSKEKLLAYDREYSRRYWIQHKEEIKKRRKIRESVLSQSTNPNRISREERLKRQQIRRAANKEAIAARRKELRNANLLHVREQERIRAARRPKRKHVPRKLSIEQKKRKSIANSEWNKRNKSLVREASRRWAKRNPDKVKTKRRRRAQRQRENLSNGYVIKTLRNAGHKTWPKTLIELKRIELNVFRTLRKHRKSANA